MDAVILRQSVQLQTNVISKPGPWVGYALEHGVSAALPYFTQEIEGARYRKPDFKHGRVSLTNDSCTAPQ
jgi:hypothetical protein